MSHKAMLTAVLVLLAFAVSVMFADAQGPKPTPPKPKAPKANAGTAFTYQGQLKKNGALVNGNCQFQFYLYSDAGGTSLVAGPVFLSPVSVTNGLFTVPIDFGSGAFQGDARWLKTYVACGADSLTSLGLQQLMPAPMALALPGLYTQQNGTSPNVIGGYSGNTVDGGVFAATIGGGGQSGNVNHVSANWGTIAGGTNNAIPITGTGATIGGGISNKASGNQSTVAGGTDNTASRLSSTVSGGNLNNAIGDGATIGGGWSNTASGIGATIGGGNAISVTGWLATVGGGCCNSASGTGAFVGGGGLDGTNFRGNLAQGNASMIGGGISNTVAIGGLWSTIGGGAYNTTSGGAATVGGGNQNIAGGSYATIGGGESNTASGQSATVPGGQSNHAIGDYSFAAGWGSYANHFGTFVWTCGDCNATPSSAPDQFIISAAGGITMYTNTGLTQGARLLPGSGTWADMSDRNMKANLAPTNGQEILARLNNIPIQTWNYTTQDASIRHIGPMAQDFYAAFNVGEDDKHITTIDSEGVALAAIQGLYQVVQEKDAKIVAQQKQIDVSQKQNASLEARVVALEQANPSARTQTNDWNLALAFVVGAIGVVAIDRARKGGTK